METLNLQRQEAPLRRLMGPGPLDVHPRVYKALSSPEIGYLHQVYLINNKTGQAQLISPCK